MDDREFDCIIGEEVLDPRLPDWETEEATPWKRAIGQITWGVGLTTCTLNFLYLNYLLPAIGVVLLLLGFRTLRRENRWFTACWCISIYQVVNKFVDLVLNATLWRAPENIQVWMWLALGIPLIQYLCLWKGIREVRRKAGRPDKAGAASGLAAWYVVLCVLGLIGADGWLLGLPLIVVCILILRDLYRMSDLLDGAGYQVQAAPVLASDKTVWLAWFGALLVCIPLAGLLFSRYPMEWTPRTADEQAGLEDIRETLLEQGFPELVLDDLTAEDLADCAGSLGVVTKTEEEPMNDGVEVSETTGNFTHIWTEYPVKELRMTGVAVQLPENRWKVFHHFLWQEEPKVRWTESLQLWITGVSPESHFVSEDFYQVVLSGRLLWDKDGDAFVGSYYNLGREEEYTYGFFGNDPRHDIYAEFSLPLRGENCRGYVSYSAKENNAGEIFFDSWMNYTHQRGCFNYPAQTAKEYRMNNIFGSSRFITAQSQIFAQFSTGEREYGDEN